ncbi:hypothetical protein FY034_17215 (plasmid) [Trichlorobacter lovleyi]|uniref:hypothetical protein n=1 Tax=Trichlorobacter lovleyi TaxID=313985 RepID=UPI00223F2E94|nr:hypothetical protein [Trichlorobacter lovleyi]QOX80763.1 hypothetical protein FY034_17215 [Trichlorobacter lovleyi]
MKFQITEAELFTAIDNAVAGHMRKDPAVKGSSRRSVLVAPAGRLNSINGLPLIPVSPKSQLVAKWGFDAIPGGASC